MWKYLPQVQSSSVARSCPTLCNPMNCSTPGFPVHPPTPGVYSKLMCIKSVMPSSHLIFCRPLLPLPSIFPSIRIFSNESALRIRWPKYWSFSFSISPSNEYPGLTSFRMEWLDLLAGARGTPRKLHRVKPLGRGRGRAGARGGGNPRFPGPAFVFAQTAYWEIQRSCSTSANAVPSAISTLQRNTASEK